MVHLNRTCPSDVYSDTRAMGRALDVLIFTMGRYHSNGRGKGKGEGRKGEV